MAETINIAKMAERLSDELFKEFLWNRMVPTNINWPCEDQENHKSKTHPSDVVFYYEEPYRQARTYVNCDLKSYAKVSISAGAIRAAIESLAKALSCAEKSNEYRSNFLHQNASSEICGLLFIYNHDGEYDKDFSVLLGKVTNEKLDIPTKSKIVVFGPSDIYWLDNVCQEIIRMRGGSKELPDREYCKYFYPNLVRKKNVQPQAKAATLEMLTAPWIILSYTNAENQNQKGIVIFYRKRGELVEEFLYLIDYLLHYQMIEDNTKIFIKMLDQHPNAAASFNKAIDQYIDEYDGSKAMRDSLIKIQLTKINRVRAEFSEIELGMRDV